MLPKTFYPFAVTLFRHIHPSRKKINVLPYGDIWVIKERDEQFFVPPSSISINRFSDGINSRLEGVFEKYSFEPYVKVEKGDIVCDVGAFIGEFSISVAKEAGQIIAFEPDPIARSCLLRNTNSIKNILVSKEALWNCKKKLDFKISTPHADSSVLDVDSKVINNRVEVQGRRLDKKIQELGYSNIDFLKVEAEGAEYEVLKGADSILKSTRKIAVDCGPERYGESPQDKIQELLESYGFNTVDKIASKCHPVDMVYGWN